VRDVRERAAEILAAVGPIKLRTIALFRAKKWAEISINMDDRIHAQAEWVRAAEWLRIGWTLSHEQHRIGIKDVTRWRHGH
jgi:hypothetical protein